MRIMLEVIFMLGLGFFLCLIGYLKGIKDGLRLSGEEKIEERI